MKKLVLFLIMFIGIFTVKANENNIPKNVYYEKDNLYAYLTYSEELYNYCVDTDCKIYIEYNWKSLDDITWQKNELIEVTNADMRNLIIDKNNPYYLLNNLHFSDIVIKARYIVLNNDYEWSKEEGIKVFNFAESPVPIIENIDVIPEKKQIDYNFKNKSEIENYFSECVKIYDMPINYGLEYRVNDVAWKSTIDFDNINFDDVRIEVRLKYNINNYQSNSSNILIYERHPEIQTCLFNSNLCCNEILNISLCIWLLSLFILVVITLIVIENVNRRKREA